MRQKPPVPTLVAAVLGPALVLGLTGLAMWANDTFVKEDTDRESEGNSNDDLVSWRAVDSGQLSPEELMAAMEDRLRSEPEVLVVGNSYAGTVNPGLLARELGVPPEKVVTLSIPYSVAGHWRGVLEYGVFDEGHHPRLVIVIAPLMNGLAEAPVVRPSVWTRLWASRGRLQRTLLSAVRDASVAVALPIQPESGKPTVAHLAVNRVFHPRRMDAALHDDASWIDDGRPDDGAALTAPEGLQTVAESEIPVLARLCEEHGAKLAWVIPAMAPGTEAFVDPAPPEAFPQAAAVFHEHGATFLDLADFPMTETHFFWRMDHFTDEGGARFVPFLADVLRETGVAGERGGPLPPVRPTSEPASPEVGAGQSARWTFEPWTAGPGYFEARFLGRTSGAPPKVVVGGAEVALTTTGPAVEGRSTVVPTGPWTLEVTAADALTVEGLSIGAGPGRTVLVGTWADLGGRSFDLLAGGWLEGDVWTVHPAEAVYDGPPPSLGTSRAFEPEGADRAVFTVPRLAAISDVATIEATPRRARCSPVRVTEDGKVLSDTNVGRPEVRRSRDGRQSHTNDQVLFTGSDRTPPFANGRTYALVLDPARRCDGGQWLYPGDGVTIALPEEMAGRFHRPIDRLVLRGASFTGKGRVEIGVRVAGVEREHRSLLAEELAAGPVEVAFDPPIAPGEPIALRVENGPDPQTGGKAGYVLLTEATFSERRP